MFTTSPTCPGSERRARSCAAFTLIEMVIATAITALLLVISGQMTVDCEIGEQRLQMASELVVEAQNVVSSLALAIKSGYLVSPTAPAAGSNGVAQNYVAYAPIASVTASAPTYGVQNLTPPVIPAWSTLHYPLTTTSPTVSISGVSTLFNVYVTAASLTSSTSTINPFYSISANFPVGQLTGSTVPTSPTPPGFFVCYSSAHILTIGISLYGTLSDGTTVTRNVITQIYVDNP
jgi:prepilin-type N-terminal cleavage/methylation domain-containing protein